MRKSKPAPRPWPLLLVVVVICGALIAVHKRAERRGQVDAATSVLRHTVLAPPARAVQAAKAWTDTHVIAIFEGPRLAEENRSLRDKVAFLSLENRILSGDAQENARLRALLAFQSSSPDTLLAAQVLAMKPSPARDTIMLSRGVRDGVRRRMVVLDPSGALVGQVIDADADTCDVLLLTDDLSSVGSRVNGADGAPIVGICQGERALELNLLDIPQESVPKIGAVVFTSGLGDVFPANIPIGRLTAAAVDHTTYQREALVRPFADLDHLQEAFLLITQPPADANSNSAADTAGAAP